MIATLSSEGAEFLGYSAIIAATVVAVTCISYVLANLDEVQRDEVKLVVGAAFASVAVTVAVATLFLAHAFGG